MFPKLALLILALLMLAFYKLRRPLSVLPWPVLLAILSTFLYQIRWRWLDCNIRFEQLAFLLLGGFVLWQIWKGRMRFSFSFPEFLVLAMLPFIFLSSILVSPDRAYSLKKSFLYLPFYIGFIAMSQVLKKRENLDAAIDIFYRVGGIVVGLSVPFVFLYRFHLDLNMVAAKYGHLWLVGPFAVANIYGSTSVLMAAIAWMRLLGRKTDSQHEGFDWFVLVTASAGMIFSYTRAAWVGYALALLLPLFLPISGAKLKKRFLHALSPFLVVVLTLGSAVMIHRHLSQWHCQQLLQQKSDGTAHSASGFKVDKKPRLIVQDKWKGFFKGKKEWRVEIMNAAISDWKRSPWIGRGTESLIAAHGHKRRFLIAITWVAILHDWGIFAFLLHIVFLIVVSICLIKRARADGFFGRPSTAAVLLVLLIVSTLMYQATTAMPLGIFWILLAFFASARTSFQKDDKIS